MNKKIVMPIALLTLLSLVVFVYAEQNVPNYNVQITKGWNLIPRSYFFWGSSGDINSCTENFKFGYFLDPYQQQYFGGKLKKMNAPSGDSKIYEFEESSNNEKFARVYDGKLPGLDVMWVYSSADCSLDTGRELVSYTTSQKQFPEHQLQDIRDIQLLRGWNFFAIPDFWKDEDSLKDYLGNCEVTRVAVWDAHSQKWAEQVNSMSVSDVLTQLKISPKIRASSFPILLKVSQTCNLEYIKYGGSPSAPPSLPDNGNEDSTPSASCTDSDGGQNYYVKGTARGLNAFGEGGTATDYCVYAGVEGTYGTYLKEGQEAVMEYVCNNQGSINDDLHVCENGCQDGACIR